MKAARIAGAFATLKRGWRRRGPNVIVVFGDDQLECFDFRNYPAFAIYAGDKFQGVLASGGSAGVPGHPGLAAALLTGLMRRGFDPAFSLDMPKPDRGIGHAFLRPAESLTDFTTPIVPVFLNCYYAPQPTALRCYQLGAASANHRRAAGHLRVAVVAGRPLEHAAREGRVPGRDVRSRDPEIETPATPRHGALLRRLRGAAATPVRRSRAGPGATGLPGARGPRGGTRETCNWIAAAAVAEGRPATVVDYVPIYSSPIGAGFAYWRTE